MTSFKIDILSGTVEAFDKVVREFVTYDLSGVDGEEVYVVEKDGIIKKAEYHTRYRFVVPLVVFDSNFTRAMNQIVIDRYESGTIFKMIVTNDNRAGFFAIIHIE